MIGKGREIVQKEKGKEEQLSAILVLIQDTLTEVKKLLTAAEKDLLEVGKAVQMPKKTEAAERVNDQARARLVEAESKQQ